MVLETSGAHHQAAEAKEKVAKTNRILQIAKVAGHIEYASPADSVDLLRLKKDTGVGFETLSYLLYVGYQSEINLRYRTFIDGTLPSIGNYQLPTIFRNASQKLRNETDEKDKYLSDRERDLRKSVRSLVVDVDEGSDSLREQVPDPSSGDENSMKPAGREKLKFDEDALVNVLKGGAHERLTAMQYKTLSLWLGLEDGRKWTPDEIKDFFGLKSIQVIHDRIRSVIIKLGNKNPLMISNSPDTKTQA